MHLDAAMLKIYNQAFHHYNQYNYSPSDKIDQSKRTADIQGPGALQTGRKLYKRRVVTPAA